MNSSVAAKIGKGIRRIQGLWGEVIEISSTSVPAILGPEALSQKFTTEGMREVIHLAASIAKADLQAPPVLGTPATARNRAWRIDTVTPTQTTWELVLESPKK